MDTFIDRLRQVTSDELREWLDEEAQRLAMAEAQEAARRLARAIHFTRTNDAGQAPPRLEPDRPPLPPDFEQRLAEYQLRARQDARFRVLLRELALGWYDQAVLRDKPISPQLKVLVVKAHKLVWPERTPAEIAEKLPLLGVDEAFVERVLRGRYCVMCAGSLERRRAQTDTCSDRCRAKKSRRQRSRASTAPNVSQFRGTPDKARISRKPSTRAKSRANTHRSPQAGVP